MEDSELNELRAKLEIADAVTKLYVEKGGSFTMHDVAKRTGASVGELFSYFADKEEIIYFYYASLITRYRMMIEEIDDFETFTLSEKLSNFAYTSFDLMQEREEFVQQTFRSYIMHSCLQTDYEQEVEALLYDFFRDDRGKTASSDLLITDCSMRLIRKKYLHLVDFWLKDESEDKEVSVELTDKVTGLMEEALYTSVVDRSFDLAKFLFANDVIATKVPLWKKISSSFEIR